VSSLPNSGELSYNGYTWPVETSTEVSVVPKYDAAGRTVTHNEITLSADWLVSGRPTDAATLDLRRRITKPGAALRYAGRGWGLAVNVGGVKDVLWGPKPRLLAAKPLGGGNASRLRWQVEVAIPECGDAAYQFAPMEYCYKVAYDVDRSGYTRRTVSGFVRVPMTRRNVANRTLPDSVDSYREAINPPLLFGFRRIPGTFTISEDKCRLDFSIVDEEMPPNAPPPGVVEARADHTVSCPPGKFLMWNHTITATYEVAKGVSVARAYEAFFALFKDRFGAIVRQNPGRGFVPVTFALAEPQVYGKTECRFAVTFAVIGGDLRETLAAGTLWRPAPLGRWRDWALSMRSPLGPRGLAQLTFHPNDDGIVDLCGRTHIVTVPGGIPQAEDRELRNRLEDLFPAPTPASSWVHYECAVRAEDEHGNVITKVFTDSELRGNPGDRKGAFPAEPAALQPINPGSRNPIFPAAGIGGTSATQPIPTASRVLLEGGGRLENNQEAKGVTKAQQRVTPTVYLFLTGRAVRQGYQIPCPELLDVNGQAPVPCSRTDRGEGFWQTVVGNAGGPIYAAGWNLRYCLTDPAPGPLPVPKNPLNGAY